MQKTNIFTSFLSVGQAVL